MSETFKTGELFVYVNGDRWELGMVKRPNNTGDGYFCWYSRGDTAANTPLSHMHKLANAGWTHIEEALYKAANVVVESTGTCPVDYLEVTDDVHCEQRCREGCEGECWHDWFTGRLRAT